MNVWIRCSKCHHQQHMEGVKSFSTNPCPKCGHDRFDMRTNRKPDWWVDQDEARSALERKP